MCAYLRVFSRRHTAWNNTGRTKAGKQQLERRSGRRQLLSALLSGLTAAGGALELSRARTCWSSCHVASGGPGGAWGLAGAQRWG